MKYWNKINGTIEKCYMAWKIALCVRTLIFDGFMEVNNEHDNLKQSDNDHLLEEVVDVIGPLVYPNNNSSLSLLSKRSLIVDIQTSIKIPKLMDNLSSHVLPLKIKSLPVTTLTLVKPSIDLVYSNATNDTNDNVGKT